MQHFKSPSCVYVRRPKHVENHRYASPPYAYQRRGKEQQPTTATNNSLSTVAQGITLSTLKLASSTIPSNDQDDMIHDEWNKAIEEEITALNNNDTGTLTDLPEGKRVVGCKQVCTLKFKADGSIDRYKAILVAREFNQTAGVDYETFSLVAKLNFVNLVFLAATFNWELHQHDIKNAFLHGDLQEVYIM